MDIADRTHGKHYRYYNGKRYEYHSITEVRYTENALPPSHYDPGRVGKFLCVCCDVWYLEEETEVHHIHPLFVGGVNFKWNLIRICASCHAIISVGKTWRAWVLTRYLEYVMMTWFGALYCLQPGNKWGDWVRGIWAEPEFEKVLRGEFDNPSIFDKGRFLKRCIYEISWRKMVNLGGIKDDHEAVVQYQEGLDRECENLGGLEEVTRRN